MKTIFAAVTIVALSAMPIAAESLEKCREIKDNKARLACFDAASVPASKATPATVTKSPVDPALAQQRSAYANSIEKVFLKTGTDVTVMVAEKKDSAAAPGTAAEYPRLIIWAYIGKPFIYQMISETEILKTAQSLGFKIVDFWDKGQSGHWFYDVGGTEIPRCDRNRGLCRD